MQNIVELQKEVYRKGELFTYQKRVELLKQLDHVIRKHMDEIHQALSQDLSRSSTESFLAETSYVLGDIKHTLKNLKKWMRPKRVFGGLFQLPSRSYIVREPLGSVLVIAPWNYPFQLSLSPLVAAWAAGNSVVLKPSELVENTSSIINKIISENFPEQYVKVIEGGVEETTQLLDFNFDKIFFTGGTAVGKIIMEKAAKNLTPVTLELGGKSPCIVWDCKDLDMAAQRIIWGKGFNCGQTCIAPDYIVVKKGERLKLADKLQEKIHQFYGKEMLRSPDYARIVNDRHFDRLNQLVEKNEIIHGGATDREQRFMELTLLSAGIDSKVMEDEIFGPLLPIVEFECLNDAFDFIKKRPKPLALYAFTDNKTIEKDVVDQLSAGGVCLNDTLMHFSAHQLPFGGVGDSGMGRYHGHFGFEAFTHPKAVMKRYFFFDLSLRYPPFGEKKSKWLRKLISWFG